MTPFGSRLDHQLLLALVRKLLRLIPCKSPCPAPDPCSRLSYRKRVEILLLVQICQRVINESMRSFIGSYGLDHV